MLARRWIICSTFALCLLSSRAALAVVVDVNCRGTATDAALLNGLIASSHNGDEIRIHGTCLVNATVVLLGNRTYVGDSRTGTIVQQASGANLPALLASDSWDSNSTTTGEPIRIAHLTLDGNKAANTGTSVLVIRSWLTVIEDIVVQNAPADGIQITNLGKHRLALHNTQVNGRISNCFITDSGGTGIHIVDTGNSVTDWDLLDCWIANSGQSAIYMDNAAGWKVRGNHLYGVQEHALFANRCFGTSIEENYIEDFGGAGGAGNTWFGIACTVQGDAASVISANKVFRFQTGNSGGSFVYVGAPHVNYGAGQINVVNNTIRGSGAAAETGLLYQANNPGTSLVVLSSDNNVQSVATTRTVGAGVSLAPGF